MTNNHLLTNAFGLPRPPPPPPINVQTTSGASAVIPFAIEEIEWRRVIGAFQLTIPVKAKEELLLTEERQLAVLRWIAESIPYSNRWYPVFIRYLQQVVGRV